ncbi:F-box LRR-repeat 20 isoform X3, partial [Paramuricea clavata]
LRHCNFKCPEYNSMVERSLTKIMIIRRFEHLDNFNECLIIQAKRLLSIPKFNVWHRIHHFAYDPEMMIIDEEAILPKPNRSYMSYSQSLLTTGSRTLGHGFLLKAIVFTCLHTQSLIFMELSRLSDCTASCMPRFSVDLHDGKRSLCYAYIIRRMHTKLNQTAQGCDKLEHINVSWCGQITRNGVRILSEECSHLKSFISKGCTLIQDEGVQHLARNCRNLQTLNLHSCELLTDIAIKAVGENCSDVQFLCVSGCLHLTDASLQALGEGCPHLRTIEVAQCSQLTDAGFSKLAKGCHNLEKMDLEECVMITDATLTNLSTWCSNLRQLSLSHCEQISDDGIHRLSAGHNAEEYLEVLELDNCPSITDTALYHLRDCKSLKRIELYDCQLITRGGIRRLKMHLPNLRVHAYFAPVTPPPSIGGGRRRVCRCCTIV